MALPFVAGCGEPPEAVGGEPGAPLPGLPVEALAEFHAGRALFDKVFLPEEGLGPLFNENQCSACHTVPASGGTTGFERIIRAARQDGERCDELHAEGGENVRTQATPLLRLRGIAKQEIPSSATQVARFLPPPLFGLGLIEAIPERTILSREDPDDANGDGISGRAGRTEDGRVARFGRKAEFATIAEFVESALQLEMGLTTPGRMSEGALGGAPVPSSADPAPEPEIGPERIALLTAFVRYLVPPAPTPTRSTAHEDSLRAGRQLFERAGCSACHTPTMATGKADLSALHRRGVALYSDLLLHDMGPALENVCAHGASSRELRTAALMGLRHRDRLLFDGRTSDLREAINAHGGEAARSRERFDGLSWSAQEILLAFLRSL